MVKLKNALFTFGLFLSMVLAANACAQQTATQAAVTDFQKFWSEFRTAVLAKDKAKVVSMTQFPLTTRGTRDSDPVIAHNKESFTKIWDKLLVQDPGLSPEPDTMQHMIEKKTTITSKDVTMSGNAQSARVGNFVFRKVKDKWFLTHAYHE